MDETEVFTGHKEIAKRISFRTNMITKHSNYKAIVFIFKGHRTLSITGYGITFNDEVTKIITMYGNMVKMTIGRHNIAPANLEAMSEFICERSQQSKLTFEKINLTELHRCSVKLPEVVMEDMFKDDENTAEEPTTENKMNNKIETLEKLIHTIKKDHDVDCMALIFKIEPKRDKVTPIIVHSKGVPCYLHAAEMSEKIMELIIYL